MNRPSSSPLQLPTKLVSERSLVSYGSSGYYESGGSISESVSPRNGRLWTGESSRPNTVTSQSARKKDTDNYYKRIAVVSGRILEAKNLKKNGSTWSSPDPYCLRGEGHPLQQPPRAVYKTTRADDTVNPDWKESFQFECPLSWGYNQLVGLKFFVFNADLKVTSDNGSDDFLGGADLDLYDAPPNKTINHTLELGGVEMTTVPTKGPKKKKRALLWVQVQVIHEYLPKPQPPADILLHSLVSYKRVSELELRIVKAKHLRSADVVGSSDPQCIVRVITLNGSVVEVFRSQVIKDTLNPEWDVSFKQSFATANSPGHEPVLVVVDLFDWDAGSKDVLKTGEHLGSAILSLWDLPDSTRRKKRLDLVGQSQLLETFLRKSGEPHSLRGTPTPRSRKGDDGAVSAFTDTLSLGVRGVAGAVTGAIKKIKNIKVTAESPTLLLEAVVEREEEPMPLADLLFESMEVREEEDVEKVVSLPDWDSSCFKVPKQLKHEHEAQCRPKLATLMAKDKIIFVSGVVRGASGLISSELFGRANPYCIVEGQTVQNQPFFIHRTRVVKDRLCPSWNEAFYFVVPEKIQLQRLNFYVHDSEDLVTGLMDMVRQGNMDRGDDELLGQMSIDLSYLCNGQSIREDVPLTGCKRQKQPKVNPNQEPSSQQHSTAFRRNPLVSIEVRVERRACPVYEVLRDQVVWQPMKRHHVTRNPPVYRIYRDPGQTAIKLPNHELIAPEVLAAWEGNKLVDMYGSDLLPQLREGLWQRSVEPGAYRELKCPPKGLEALLPQEPPDDAPTEDELIEAKRKRMGEEGPDNEHEMAGVARSGKPTRTRASSLPALHTKFGRRDCPQSRQFAQMRPAWVDDLRFLRGMPSEAPRAMLGRKLPLALCT
eukprot:CAMPEP_0206511516 /NCGR_PEP_ID=MMETSP0324_2-20121206/60333_1 /ASSEMBLY_ACC=CAM_ASM_000836 /TAXON_ID=2866 /ORGANISM="Crypthecodinium cohnii, Strain Seligo" /LENGTH=879 /DNA_ID=CAMNT_0054003303 /DNA_START=160 /DNA_END=2800 /DNA_ORIENTATION=-